jgi:carboxyl-terminal processing protease
MQTRVTTRRLLPLTAILLASLIAPPPGRAVAGGNLSSQDLVADWTHSVREAAPRRDASSLERWLETIPTSSAEPEAVDRFRTSLEHLRMTRTEKRTARAEQQAKLAEEMRAEVATGHLGKALRKAAMVQSLGDDLATSLADASIRTLIQDAERQVTELEIERRWLDAQDLLYLLRTLHEDTKNPEYELAFQRYDDSLERVNLRVGLIARYAPRALHEMRNELAVREGDEPFGEFNPATAIDWQERVADIDHKMLKAALRTAAAEHIEQDGWRPLISGGLEALRLIATTPALAESFPTIGDAARAKAWLDEIDRQEAQLAEAKDGDLDRWALNDVLDAVDRLNARSLELPQGVIFREFGDGALGELDVYSEIIWPEKLRRFQQSTAGNFVGVGIVIRHGDKREILVVNPLEGSPAYEAGVKPSDVIVAVDGESTVGWALNDAVDRITGREGTSVRLALKREGVEAPIEVEIARALIKIPSVKGWFKRGLDERREPVWDWYVDDASRIAYIRLTQFTEDTYEDLKVAAQQIEQGGGMSGLILDLRHNPGGLLTSAVQVSNLFVGKPRAVIVTGEDKQGQPAWHQSVREENALFAQRGVPTVVLINKGSASASEIVAGCLQAHDAALIVGERSFGKGSVQTIHQVSNQCRLKLTTQYYRLPSPDGGRTPGRLVHRRPGAEEWGVDPDIVVPMSDQLVAEAINLRQAAEMIPLNEAGVLDPDAPDRANVRQLLTDGIDPQLATALLILQAQAMKDSPARGS